MVVGTIYHPQILGKYYPNSRKAHAAAAINGLELALPDDFQFQVSQKEPWYLAKFPLGKVPAYESADGDFRLWESDAIAFHLAQTGPKADQLLRLSDPREAAKVQQWIFFSTCHLQGTCLGLVGWRLGFGQYDKEKEDEHERDINRWLTYMEGQLEGKTWLAGTKDVSLADLTVAGSMCVGLIGYMDKEFRAKYPGVFGWFERCTSIDEVREIFAVDWVEKKKEPEAS